MMTELINTQHIATRLGITRRRVRKIIETHPEFPEPAFQSPNGHIRLWAADDIATWEETWDRAPGRASPQ
jgi:hypothetical protein